jgi:hypothetical protein
MEGELDPKDLARLQKIWGAKLRPKGDYARARDGDHVMVPFECDLCVFRKLRDTDRPDASSERDKLLMACIRRMILDAFWSRATSTVNGHRDRAAFGLRLSALVKLKGPYIHRGPLPDYDHCGYEVAIQMLLHSRRKGKTDASYVQFDSIRKMRAVFSNQVRASPQATAVTLSLGDQVGHYQRFSIDPCASFWFARFFQGCRFRMGQDWRPNQAMSMDLLLRMLETVRLRINDATSPRDLNRWIVFHSYATVTYVVSLRGPEGLLLDLAGLHRNWGKESDESYFFLALLGKIKGEQHDRCHLIPCSNKTESGIDVKGSVARLVAYKQTKKTMDGPAITDENGRPMTCRDIDDMMHEILEELFESDRSLFPPSIKDLETLRSAYQAFRTLRRTSDTRALEMKVARDDIDIVNRWEQVEKAQGRKMGGQAMRHYYADATLLKGPFKRYTSAM